MRLGRIAATATSWCQHHYLRIPGSPVTSGVRRGSAKPDSPIADVLLVPCSNSISLYARSTLAQRAGLPLRSPGPSNSSVFGDCPAVGSKQLSSWTASFEGMRPPSCFPYLPSQFRTKPQHHQLLASLTSDIASALFLSWAHFGSRLYLLGARANHRHLNVPAGTGSAASGSISPAACCCPSLVRFGTGPGCHA